MAAATSLLPEPSALSNLLTASHVKTAADALPLELLHNLQYQHDWTDLRTWSPSSGSPFSLDLSRVSPTSHPSIRQPPVKLVTGIPPRHVYTHPDFLAHLVSHGIDVNDVPIHAEYVLPMSIAEKWSLARLSAVFDALPTREPLSGADGHKHQDAKRVLLGMLSHNGCGGDGTITYYIMQEGDIKPRQN